MLPHRRGPVDVLARVPGSKSLAARWLVLAAQAGDPPRITGLPDGDDTATMLAALRTMPHGHVDCGRAGTVLRFLLPLAAAGSGAVRFTGDPQLAARPLAGLVDALRALGAGVETPGDGRCLPLTITPGRPAGQTPALRIDASASSQLVSGLLLAAPSMPHGITLAWDEAPSSGHIAMTVDCLGLAGQGVTFEARGDLDVATVHPRPVDLSRACGPDGAIHVEPDLPAAATFLLAVAVLGGTGRIDRWPERARQDTLALQGVLQALGCQVTDDLRVTKAPRRPHGIDLDLRAHVELLPTVAAACALADSPSALTGLRHARGHESDRIAVTAENLRSIGAEVGTTDDALVIRPTADPRPTTPWRTAGDHRHAMAGALVGLACPGLALDDGTVVSKTYPAFLDDWSRMFSQDGR